MSSTFVPGIQSNKEGFYRCQTYRPGNKIGQGPVYGKHRRLCGILRLTHSVMLQEVSELQRWTVASE